MRDRYWGLMLAALAAGGLTGLMASPAGAGTIQVVSAGDEYEAFHPHPHRLAAPGVASGEQFQATMDRVFGPGRWRATSGYRTQAQENALRRQGAGTVAPGHVSLHSLGGPQAPGAYDAVVERMSAAAAAARLRRAGGPFAKVLAEGAHGSEGPHLHIELVATRARGRAQAASADAADN